MPFEYAFRYDLTGTRDTVHNQTVTVSVEAAFTAVAVGYGLVPTADPIRFGELPTPVILLSPITPPPPQLVAIATMASAAAKGWVNRPARVPSRLAREPPPPCAMAFGSIRIFSKWSSSH